MFDPAHDLALAVGVRHFNPPAFVQRMAEDLAGLAVWCDGPWGWNYDARAAMLRSGTPAAALPSDDDLHALRRLSSRERTTEILRAFADLCPAVAPPRRLADAAELAAVLAEAEAAQRPIVLKSPWSSSGRGLMRYLPTGDSGPDRRSLDTLRRHGEAVIRRMGCVMAEPWYTTKRRDFAMLFRIGRDGIVWEGYSLFETDAQGTYRSGLLASDERIESILCADADAAADGAALLRGRLAAIRERYGQVILPRLFDALMERPWEVGYVGIDMMTLDHGNGIGVHPCVEMNVRCTMGVVARHAFDRGATAGREGWLRIVTRPDGHFAAEIDAPAFAP